MIFVLYIQCFNCVCAFVVLHCKLSNCCHEYVIFSDAHIDVLKFNRIFIWAQTNRKRTILQTFCQRHRLEEDLLQTHTKAVDSWARLSPEIPCRRTSFITYSVTNTAVWCRMNQCPPMSLYITELNDYDYRQMTITLNPVKTDMK